MSLFGGCGNDNNWIWVLIVLILVFGCCDNDRGLFGGRNCGCDSRDDSCC